MALINNEEEKESSPNGFPGAPSNYVSNTKQRNKKKGIGSPGPPPGFPAPSGPDERGPKEVCEIESMQSEHSRRQNLLSLIHHIVRSILIVLAVLSVIAIISVAWHLMVPDKYQWLNNSQFKTLVTILSSGALSILANNYFRKG